MLLNNLIHYESGYKHMFNNFDDDFFYMFDYDTRSYQVNMEFQHQHPFYEICVFLDERAGHIIEGNWYDLRFGDIVLLKPFLLHKTQYPEGAANKRLMIRFSLPLGENELDEMYSNLLNLFNDQDYVYRFGGPEKREIYNSLNGILALAKSSHNLKDLLIHQKFIDFLGLIYTNQKQNRYKNKSRLDSITSKIYNITSYIHSNYQDKLTLKTISKKFYISEYYLSHQFKKVTGFTLTNYIQITRVRIVQNILDNTDIRISDIAFKCGFTSFSQFSRVFKKHTDMSPSEYRNRFNNID